MGMGIGRTIGYGTNMVTGGGLAPNSRGWSAFGRNGPFVEVFGGN